VLLGAGSVCLGHGADRTPMRRAVVVGINQYDRGPRAAPGPATAGLVARKPLAGTGARAEYSNLDGAVNESNDVAALLSSRYHFDHV